MSRRRLVVFSTSTTIICFLLVLVVRHWYPRNGSASRYALAGCPDERISGFRSETVRAGPTNTTAATFTTTATFAAEGQRIASPNTNFDVYIVLTPSENSLGGAAARELVERLPPFVNDSSGHPRRARNVVCIVRCPPSGPHRERQSWWTRAFPFFHNFRGHHSIDKSGGKNENRGKDESPIILDEVHAFDPFCGTKRSAEHCLSRIFNHLMAFKAICLFETANAWRKRDLVSTRIRIRGILCNPYGCPQIDSIGNLGENERNTTNTVSISPLADYKLLSIARFLNVAMHTKTLTITIPMKTLLSEFLVDSGSFNRDLVNGTWKSYNQRVRVKKGRMQNNKSPLRIVIVGTEAARGLPRMGIPVPELKEEEDDSSIRNRLLHNPTASPKSSKDGATTHWQGEYAEMNAISVLYFKALSNRLRSRYANTFYIGTVSPGMTFESLKIDHVPKSGRRPSFRLKLWLCRLPWVFDWLRKQEIAKTTEEGAALLVRALMNDPVADGDCHSVSHTRDTDRPDSLLQWDDVYPSGSFVGAESGTGGPLCEQTQLVYNATSGRVSLSASEDGTISRSSRETKKDTFVNFLANHRLQNTVFRIVGEFIDR